MKRKLLQEFRTKISFLNLIPDSIYFNLKTPEFYLPDNRINLMRKNLEHILGHYVMTYKRNVFDTSIDPQQHLCGNIRGATLQDYQKVILQEYERNVRRFGMSFVVYQNPLKVIKVTQSDLYTYYQQKNLI